MLRLVASPKVKMINVRLKPETHDEFKIACELRGGSMSSIMHQFIVRTIREEKERDPRAFIIEPPSRTLAARTQSSSRPRINAEELNRRKAGDNPNKKKTKRVA